MKIGGKVSKARKIIARRTRRASRAIARRKRKVAIAAIITMAYAVETGNNTFHTFATKVDKTITEIVIGNKKETKRAKAKVIDKYKAPTSSEVVSYARSAGASHPEWLAAHMALESAWYKSYIARSLNNIGGLGGPGRYMKFDSWERCVDYVIKMQKKQGLKPGDNYTDWLDRTPYHGANKQSYNRLLHSIYAMVVRNDSAEQ